MQNQSHEMNSNKNISFNIDEFDIESYDFKPVTKGLGFHGEKETTKTIKVSEVKIKANPSKPRAAMTTSIPGHLNNSPAAKPLGPSLMSGIDAIYNREPVKVQKEEVRPAKTETISLKSPSYLELMIAYVIDFASVGLFTLVLFNAFYALVFKEINVIETINFIKSSWDFFAVFFALVYVSYFTILGPVDSLGKKMFHISQRDEKNQAERVSVKQSFLNAMISLLSIPLLFVPILFDFHNKISGIKTVKTQD